MQKRQASYARAQMTRRTRWGGGSGDKGRKDKLTGYRLPVHVLDHVLVDLLLEPKVAQDLDGRDAVAPDLFEEGKA